MKYISSSFTVIIFVLSQSMFITYWLSVKTEYIRQSSCWHSINDKVNWTDHTSLAHSVLKIWVTFWATGLKRGAAIFKKLNYQTSSVSSFFSSSFFLSFFGQLFVLDIFVLVLLSIHLKSSSVTGLWDFSFVVVETHY